MSAWKFWRKRARPARPVAAPAATPREGADEASLEQLAEILGMARQPLDEEAAGLADIPEEAGELREFLLDLDAGAEPPSRGLRRSVLVRLGLEDQVRAHEREEVVLAVERAETHRALTGVTRLLGGVNAAYDGQLEQVADHVRDDVVLASRVLRLANSTFLGRDEPVDDLERAVAVLGYDRIRFLDTAKQTLAQIVAMVEGINWRALWRHQLACGLLAQEIVEFLRLPRQPSIYVCGLTHDLGKIVLSLLYPDDYRVCLRMACLRRLPLRLCEELVFGLDHEIAGGLHAVRTQLPKALEETMRYHRVPARASPAVRETVAIVNVANHVATQFRLGFSGNPVDRLPGAFAEVPGWTMLAEERKLGSEPEALAAHLAKRARTLGPELGVLLGELAPGATESG